MLGVIFYALLLVVGVAILAFVVAPVLASLFSLFVAIFPIPKVPLIYNLRNLQVRWLTALVTSIAIVLVVALMTFMLAFVKGMDKLTEGSGKPGNILILADGATDEAFSRLEPYGVQQLPQDVQNVIARTANGDYLFTKEVYVIVTHLATNPITGDRKRRFCQMRGIDDPVLAGAIHDIELMDIGGHKSRWFAPTGEKEVVLGNGVAKAFAKDLGKEILVPGDEVEIGNWTWKVVGVMSPASSTFGSEIWVHDRIVQDNFGRANSYSSFVLQVKDPARTRAAAEALKKIGTIAFTVTPERDYYAKMSQTTDQFRYACYFVAIVMAIGGVLGVMITMFAAVSQRAKDIGVLRLLGFARWQILSSFMLETLAIGVIGGVLGVALGSLCNGVTVSSIVSSGPGGGGKSVVLQMTVDFALMMAGMLFALVMSAIGGFIPAIFAMRLRPLESLR
ncbi:MAG: ABC transporter permease [Planctomycetota bacterium]